MTQIDEYCTFILNVLKRNYNDHNKNRIINYITNLVINFCFGPGPSYFNILPSFLNPTNLLFTQLQKYGINFDIFKKLQDKIRELNKNKVDNDNKYNQIYNFLVTNVTYNTLDRGQIEEDIYQGIYERYLCYLPYGTSKKIKKTLKKKIQSKKHLNLNNDQMKKHITFIDSIKTTTYKNKVKNIKVHMDKKRIDVINQRCAYKLEQEKELKINDIVNYLKNFNQPPTQSPTVNLIVFLYFWSMVNYKDRIYLFLKYPKHKLFTYNTRKEIIL